MRLVTTAALVAVSFAPWVWFVYHLGIAGFQEYQAPTTYVDASINYSFARHFQVFLDGSNLTHEKEHYYLVWPDMKLNTTQFESRYALGVRAKF